MTAPPPDKYARVYYKIVHDDRFATIYPDDRHLATWLRLLISADASWPNHPPIPRTIRKASLDALVASGLVELMPQDCYRIHGLDRERNARAQKARDAAAKRWDSDSNADALPEQSVSNAEPLLAEQSRGEQSKAGAEGTPRPPTPRRIVLDWLKANGYREPSGWAHKTFDEMVAVLGPDGLIPVLAEGKASGIKFTTPLIQYAERSQSPRNGTKPGKYLEHDPKELADAFVRD